MQRLGLDRAGYGELLAVVGLFNQMNKLADGLQIEPDVVPKIFRPFFSTKAKIGGSGLGLPTTKKPGAGSKELQEMLYFTSVC